MSSDALAVLAVLVPIAIYVVGLIIAVNIFYFIIDPLYESDRFLDSVLLAMVWPGFFVFGIGYVFFKFVTIPARWLRRKYE